MTWLESLPIFGTGVIVVGGFLVLTLGIGWLIDVLFPHEVRVEHNDLAGFILAVIGVVYAVLLAFVAVSVWERFNQAEARAYDEASSLAIVYRDVGNFPQQTTALRASLTRYVSLVVRREWPAMQRGEQSEEANLLIERIDRSIRGLPVGTMAQADVHQQMLAAMNEALTDRETRLSMDATGIDGVMWLVLLIGAVVTVGFTYLFGFRHEAMRYVMTGSLGVLIGLVLFLTVALDYPFRGGVVVPPEALLKALETFRVVGS
ncbi:MAG TPA: DUF4239 domain-containing protein [Candidatus Sulfotelmatobacter sp.]|nr:DUF4239 domain-containing protein [Candidatus Sulfotelmatobacter sp.]